MVEIIKKLFFSQADSNLVSDILTSIPRIICGLLLTLTFGSDKFGDMISADGKDIYKKNKR